MSTTAVLDQLATEADFLSDEFWAEFEQQRTAVSDIKVTKDPLQGAPIEVIAVPACPRKKLHLSEHLVATDRAGTRKGREEAHKAPHRPSRTPLTSLERTKLHKGTIDLESIRGRRLNRCERNIVKKLKKQRRKAAKSK